MKGEVREEARFGLGSILPALSDSRMGVSSATGPHTGRIRPQAKRIRRGERVGDRAPAIANFFGRRGCGGGAAISTRGRVRSPYYGSYAGIVSGCSRKAINWLLLSGKIA